jgi:hypothetical protein
MSEHESGSGQGDLGAQTSAYLNYVCDFEMVQATERPNYLNSISCVMRKCVCSCLCGSIGATDKQLSVSAVWSLSRY